MIETRRKLTPQGEGQKAFWKMIDNLRSLDAAVGSIVQRLRRAERRPSYSSIEEIGLPDEPVIPSWSDYPGPALEEDQEERKARLREIRRFAPQLR